MKTIHDLRKQKYKVRVIHHRQYLAANEPFQKPAKVCLSQFELKNSVFKYHKLMQKGGFTELQVTAPDNKEYNVSVVCSRKDPYCRKRGVQIALGRFSKIVS